MRLKPFRYHTRNRTLGDVAVILITSGFGSEANAAMHERLRLGHRTPLQHEPWTALHSHRIHTPYETNVSPQTLFRCLGHGCMTMLLKCDATISVSAHGFDNGRRDPAATHDIIPASLPVTGDRNASASRSILPHPYSTAGRM
jgi:hypothetical protein